MPANALAQPFIRLIHDADQNAYDAALSEGWHVMPERTRRVFPAPNTEPRSDYLRPRRTSVRVMRRRRG